MHDHVKGKLNSVSVSTSTDPNYTYYAYDKLNNLSLDHVDTRILLNRGLTIYPWSCGCQAQQPKITAVCQ